MSNRAVKKLKQKLQKNNENSDDEEQQVTSEDFSSDAKFSKQNLFDLLAEEEENTVESADIVEETTVEPATAPSTKPKKKKKNKSKQDNASTPTIPTVAPKKKTKSKNQDVDDDMLFLEQELQKKMNMQGNAGSTTTDSITKFALLEIDKQNLNPDNEFKKLFGSVQKQASNIKARKTVFTTVKPNWPQFFNPGLQMELVSTGADSVEMYKYVFTPAYQQVQRQLEMALNTHDPNNIAHLMYQVPYHISTVLQMSEIYQMQNDNDVANDLVDRAMFCLESSWTSAFFKVLLEGRARLHYNFAQDAKNEVEFFACIANQQLYHVLAKRMHHLHRTGCFSTALEYCKILLSLDLPFDRCHALLMIDFFALRARQFEFLLQVLDQVPQWIKEDAQTNAAVQGKVFATLPSLMLSKAMTLFLLKKLPESDQALQQALKLWPMIVPALLDHLVQEKVLNSIAPWEQLTRNSIYTDIVCNNQLYSLLLHITVERHAELWKQHQQVGIFDWLKKNMQAVLSNPDQTVHHKQRTDLYQHAAPQLSKIYGNCTSAEILGKVPPPSQSATAMQQGSTPNPFMLFLQSLIPSFRATTNMDEPEEEEIVMQ